MAELATMREYILDELGVKHWTLRSDSVSVPCFIGRSVNAEWLIMVESQGSDSARLLLESIGRVVAVTEFVYTDAASEDGAMISHHANTLILGQEIMDLYHTQLQAHKQLCQCEFSLDQLLQSPSLKADLWAKLRSFI